MADANITDLIVIRIDGGICSQILFLALGLHLKQKFGNAVRVKYDLTWFAECGRDIDGRYVRNWDVPKAFPEIPVEVATREEAEVLKSTCLYDGRDAESIVAPMYVGGYPSRRASCAEQLGFLRQSFRPILSEGSRKLLSVMQSAPCCAVHVRRGDLAHYTPAYGHPASLRYFVRALELISKERPDVRFFFFSDEPEYVRDVLLPALPADGAYVVADGNGSERGYEDLFLLSRAQFVIASVGSLGRMAAKLSETCRRIVVLRTHGGDDDYGCAKTVLDDSSAAAQTDKKGFWPWLRR